MTEVQRQLSKSSEDFLSLVWPVIGHAFGKPFAVEAVTDNSFARELDRRAGIDMWLVCWDGHMRGLTSRVQWQDDPWNTFTVRMRSRAGRPTEYHKRKAEIAAPGAVTPHYFCQAYVSKNRARLITAAVARTKDVIMAVDFDLGWLMPPNGDGTQGYAVRWQALSDAGAPLETWPPGICHPSLFTDL